MRSFVTRFAPSPSGFLHLGHAHSALCAFEAARTAAGHFVLRIEDIDTVRCRPEFEAAIFEDLRWLGLSWEHPVRRQSEHFDDYAKSLKRLNDLGVLYRCFKTRREVMADMVRAPHGVGEVYAGPANKMSTAEEDDRIGAGQPFAWRLSLAAAREVLCTNWERLHFIEEGAGPDGEQGKITARPEILGDVILARKDITTSYHLSVVHDDTLQGINHVVRGVDLFESTHMHVLLQNLLQMPTPIYRHHGLINDDSGKRLAKRNAAASLHTYRKQGLNRQDMHQMLL